MCLNLKQIQLRFQLIKYYVYVIESFGKFYVGMTTDPIRRLRQHNSELVGGARSTRGRQWLLRRVYGPYDSRSEAMRAEYALKHSRRGISRTRWSPTDNVLCIELLTSEEQGIILRTRKSHEIVGERNK